MKPLSIGKLRGLQQISSKRGTFTALALDHRQNLRKANPAFVDDAELSRFKLDVTKSLAHRATAVLLDPEVSAAQAVAQRVIPNNVGLVVAVESTGYTGDATARHAQIIPGWSVEKAKRMGASAIKLLVYYHPDSPTAHEIEDFTSKVAEDCIKHDLVLMLEPLSYSLDGNKKLSSDEKRYVVIESAKRLTPLNVDILKAEFPLNVDENSGYADREEWANACAELSVSIKIPWILLSAALDYETFLKQATIACQYGASGIAVGRAVWKEAVAMNSDERFDFLRTTAKYRLSRLTSLCHALATPYTDFFQAEAPFDWYKNYGA
jgi:tagatose-1,6-bisphosphate aldolase